MRRNFLVVAVVLMFGAAASLAAQAKPDFSGKWVMDPAAAPAAPAGGGGGGGGRGGGRGGGFGNEFTIAQNAKTLTITRMQGDQTVTTVYNLDGSESKNMVAGRGGGEPTAQISKAVWDGAKLVVTTTINAGGNNIEQKRVFAMEGANLTIETTQPGRDGGPGTPNKVTYKKG
ncbi:MAG TPA: hypothetical protein VM846_00720 [Vicinamibacterales bacterium]|jgi:hypothetical protein|nr:hypothetical protein [Vicinamibacterales bacterium]